MTIDLSIIDDVLFALTYSSKATEMTKAREFHSQLRSSIEWLTERASKEKNALTKADYLKEVAVAQKELDQLNKRMLKVETNE